VIVVAVSIVGRRTAPFVALAASIPPMIM
jgi:hypothetical protein